MNFQRFLVLGVMVPAFVACQNVSFKAVESSHGTTGIWVKKRVLAEARTGVIRCGELLLTVPDALSSDKPGDLTVLQTPDTQAETSALGKLLGIENPVLDVKDIFSTVTPNGDELTATYDVNGEQKTVTYEQATREEAERALVNKRKCLEELEKRVASGAPPVSDVDRENEAVLAKNRMALDLGNHNFNLKMDWWWLVAYAAALAGTAKYVKDHYKEFKNHLDAKTGKHVTVSKVRKWGVRGAAAALLGLGALEGAHVYNMLTSTSAKELVTQDPELADLITKDNDEFRDTVAKDSTKGDLVVKAQSALK